MRWLVGFLILGSVSLIHAGEWGNNYNVSKGAGFISLARGAKSYDGYIKDESSKYHLKDLCFGGITKIGGIRKEGDDSSSEIDMESVQSIIVVQGRFQSTDPRHTKTQEYPLFVKAKVDFRSGASEEYLFPYDMIISGVDIKTETGKAWFLRDMDKIDVKGEYKVVIDKKRITPQGVSTAKTSWWKEIVSFG